MALGSAPGILIGAGIGAAASTALEPAFEVPRQDAWKTAPHRVLDPSLIAQLVAQGGIPLDGNAYDEVHRNGYGSDKLDALIYLTQTVPGAAEAMHLWRLGVIDQGLFIHTLVKAGLDQRYIQPIVETKIEELLGLGDIAYAVVRGILPSPPYVPVAPPTHGDKVPRFPQVDIDPEALAAKIGFSPEALQVMVGRSGLSMAPGMAAQAFFRGIIGPNDFLMAIAEGDLRTEWTDAVREVSRQIPTAHDFVEGYLRGWITQQDMDDGAALHGMSPAHTDLIYKISGRPVVLNQITKGLARGANYPSAYSDVPEPYRKSLQESNIRPEWASIAYENRYTYPSGFQVRSEAQAGNLTTAQTDELLLEMGWKPEWATHFSQSWTGGKAAGGDPHVAKAQTQLWTTTHRAYLNSKATDAEATTALTAAGVAPTAIPQVLALWQEERTIDRKTLSAAQIKKAWVEQVVNPETGVAWTRDEAFAALIELGYSSTDAATFLEL